MQDCCHYNLTLGNTGVKAFLPEIEGGGAHLLPHINWMREKFCKHPSTNEGHGFE